VTIRTVSKIAAMVVSLTLIVAAVVWMIWGASAALVAIGFISAIIGLSKALIELINRLEQILAPAEENDKISLHNRSLGWAWSTALGGMVIGIGLGYLVLPRSIQWAVQPVVSVTIPAKVNVHQSVTLRWHYLPGGERIWLLVYVPSQGVSFLQRCHTAGESSGTLNCEVEIGGSDDAGKDFELRALLTDESVSLKLDELLQEPGYLRKYPSGSSLIASIPVVRKP
jgi:hypothetical protein